MKNPFTRLIANLGAARELSDTELGPVIGCGGGGGGGLGRSDGSRE